jgi:hypothetical protein
MALISDFLLLPQVFPGPAEHEDNFPNGHHIPVVLEPWSFGENATSRQNSWTSPKSPAGLFSLFRPDPANDFPDSICYSKSFRFPENIPSLVRATAVGARSA